MSTTSLFFTPPAVGASELNDLSDVTITGTPNDNDALAYDTASGKFIPQAISGGGGVSVLDDLTDVNTDTSGLTNQVNGHLLAYDTATANYTARDSLCIVGATLEVYGYSIDFFKSSAEFSAANGELALVSDIVNSANQIKSSGTNLNIETGLFFVDKTNRRVGIEQATPTSNLHVVGTSNIMTSSSVGIVSDDTDGVQIYGKSGVTNKLDQDWEVTSSGTLTSLLISGQNASAITIGGSPLSLVVNMQSVSYSTYTCSTAGAASLDNLNISNDITGSQAVIFITCTTSAMTINVVSGANVKTGYTSAISMSVNDTAVMTICSDGTNRYVNCVKYT